MRRRNNPILTLLIVLFCLVLLALAGYMLVQVLPQKAPQEVTTIETNSVFESDGQTVEPDREQAYEGELPAAALAPEAPRAQETPSAAAQSTTSMVCSNTPPSGWNAGFWGTEAHLSSSGKNSFR